MTRISAAGRHCIVRCARSAIRRAALAVACAALALPGCSADNPMNPSFPLTEAEARQELLQMRDAPVSLDRPLVIASGIHDPGLAGGNLCQKLRRVLDEDAVIIRVAFIEQWSFDKCREKLIRTLEQSLPCDDPDRTVEVDVIGISMGGLVARYAALPRSDGGRRLVIRRLFTVATPHRGARLASLPTIDSRAIDMRSGSSFLRQLDEFEADAEYEIYPYARLGDCVVGPENAAPPGTNPWWVANPPFSFAHLWASNDPRIVADIARRLRSEAPYALRPAAALPGAANPAAVAGDAPEAGLGHGG
ncbi:MAG: lipase family alpha/beta hydrolase [Planctomycetota bacterium]|jgi:pimeloyl-ACP methyl ester carboxylesterase